MAVSKVCDFEKKQFNFSIKILLKLVKIYFGFIRTVNNFALQNLTVKVDKGLNWLSMFFSI